MSTPVAYLDPANKSPTKTFWQVFGWLTWTAGITAAIILFVESASERARWEEAIYIVSGGLIIISGLVHILWPAIAAGETGHIQNDLYQFEVGVADLIIGVVQIIGSQNIESRMIIVILTCGWGWTLAANHIWSFIKGDPNGYLLRQSNRWFGAWPIVPSLQFPALLLSMYLFW